MAACGFAPRASSIEPDASADAKALDRGPDAAVDASSLTPRSFMVQLLTEECDEAFACKPQYPANAQHSFDYEWGASVDQCIATDLDYLALGAIEAAVAAGRITFDPVAAGKCLAAPGLPSTCSALFTSTYDWASSCYDALTGHVANGAACTTYWECALGSYCNATCTPY